MNDKIINGIDVSEYFINHYDNSGKLYAVEYKGNPLELQNAIKRLQEENKELKQVRKNYPDIQEPYIYLYRQIKKQCYKLQKENEELKKRQITKNGFICDCEQNAKYKQALEEIREIILKNDPECACNISNIIIKKINEAFGNE